MRELILEILKPDNQGRKITQKDLAKKMNVGSNVVSHWVTGKAKPNGENIEKIVRLKLIKPERMIEIFSGK